MRDGRDCNRYIQIEHTYVIHPTTLSIFFLPRISQYSPVHPQKHSHWPALQTPPNSEHVTLPTEQSDEKQHNTEGYCSVSVPVEKEYLMLWRPYVYMSHVHVANWPCDWLTCSGFTVCSLISIWTVTVACVPNGVLHTRATIKTVAELTKVGEPRNWEIYKTRGSTGQQQSHKAVPVDQWNSTRPKLTLFTCASCV